MDTSQLLRHIGYRLPKPFAPVTPFELCFTERERALLHTIQLIESVNVGNYLPDQSCKTVVR